MRVGRKSGGGAALTLIAVLAACSSQARSNAAVGHSVAAPAVHPVSGLPVIDLAVIHEDQSARRIHHFRVEVASTPEAQEKGLMFRTAMGPDEGMIFPMSNGQPATFWMKNTVIPLDIIFIDLNGRISNIAANARPYDETQLPSVGVVSGVLELDGGRAAQLGIGPGDAVKW